jgi:hypothetical protein
VLRKLPSAFLLVLVGVVVDERFPSPHPVSLSAIVVLVVLSKTVVVFRRRTEVVVVVLACSLVLPWVEQSQAGVGWEQKRARQEPLRCVGSLFPLHKQLCASCMRYTFLGADEEEARSYRERRKESEKKIRRPSSNGPSLPWHSNYKEQRTM